MESEQIPSEPDTEPQEDPAKEAEKVKETGNVAFKAGKYGEAIDLYTEAISEWPRSSSKKTTQLTVFFQKNSTLLNHHI